MHKNVGILVIVIILVITVILFVRVQSTSKSQLAKYRADTIGYERLKQDIENVDSIVTAINQIGDRCKTNKAEILNSSGQNVFSKAGDSDIATITNPKPKTNLWMLFFANGNLKGLRYRDISKNGFDISYFENGNVMYFNEVKNDIPDGIFADFHSNGKIATLMRTENKYFIGPAKRWDETGSLVESTEFKEPATFKAVFGTSE